MEAAAPPLQIRNSFAALLQAVGSRNRQWRIQAAGLPARVSSQSSSAQRPVRTLRQVPSGRLEGAFLGADTTGFGPGRPQLRVGGLGANRLRLVYDPIVYDAVVMDGGVLEEDLPITLGVSRLTTLSPSVRQGTLTTLASTVASTGARRAGPS